jgi:hypothetical protein
MAARLGYIQVLAGLIPLLAAVLVVWLGGDEANNKFRILVVSLILLGGVGYQVASAVVRGLSQVVVALTSTKA